MYTLKQIEQLNSYMDHTKYSNDYTSHAPYLDPCSKRLLLVVYNKENHFVIIDTEGSPIVVNPRKAAQIKAYLRLFCTVSLGDVLVGETFAYATEPQKFYVKSKVGDQLFIVDIDTFELFEIVARSELDREVVVVDRNKL